MSDLRAAAQQALEACEQRLPLKGQAAIIDELNNLRAALADGDKVAPSEPVQEQDIEDAIEAAYWQFDCRRSGLNEWASAPQSERDAFKAEARKLAKGYFPTRQAQDTKREMLAVADAFIRGKRAALAEPVQEPVAWTPIEQPYPQGSELDILMGDGSILCSVLPQYDGDLWWEGSGTGEKFIDPKYVTHWRIHSEHTAPPQRKPLSGEQLWQIELGLRIYYDNGKYDLSLHDFARAIERAHGIGEQQ